MKRLVVLAFVVTLLAPLQSFAGQSDSSQKCKQRVKERYLYPVRDFTTQEFNSNETRDQVVASFTVKVDGEEYEKWAVCEVEDGKAEHFTVTPIPFD